MNENRDDKFQEEYDVDVMADDTEDIDLFEEDDDIGDLSDFEDEEEQSKSKFLFGKNKNANSEKKPLDKKKFNNIIRWSRNCTDTWASCNTWNDKKIS